MANDVIQFVDSIASSPTVRLDLNDGVNWNTADFYAPPPRLRRSMSSNAMTNGAVASSSVYEQRVLTITCSIITASQDTAATELQKLARELDRDTNYLKWQVNGLSSPVFFKTERADFTDAVVVQASKAYYEVTIEVLAEPLALGLRETLSIGAITTATGYFDVSSANIKGDAAAPFILTDSAPDSGFTQGTSANASLYWLLARSTRSATSQPIRTEANTLTMGTDTAVSGSDAVTTFASTSSATRLTWSPTGATAAAMGGTYRLMVGATLSTVTTSASMNISAKYGSGSVANLDCANSFTGYPIDPTGSRKYLFDFGLISFTAAEAMALAPRVELIASVSSITNTRTLTWDFVYLVPTDEAATLAKATYLPAGSMPGGGSYPTASPMVFDGVEDSVYIASSTSIFSTATPVLPGWVSYSGAIPTLLPNTNNRFAYMRYADPQGAPPFTEYSNAASGTLTLYYHPRYLLLRPASS